MKQKTWSEMAIKYYKKNRPYKISETTLKAHWVDISDVTTDNGGYDWHIRALQCSNCGNMISCYYKPFYCGVCGARMVKK